MNTDVNTVEETSASAAPSSTQYDGWDSEGTPIVTKKPETKQSEETSASAASATKTQSEPKGKTAAEPEAATSQEKPKERKPGEKKSADERIAELIAENKLLREERERSRAQETKPASKTEDAKPKDAEPATYAEWRKAFKPKEWIEQWSKQNPSASYEDAVAAMGDHQADIRDSYRQLEQVKEAGVKRGQEMLRKVLETYPDAEAKVKETAKRIFQQEGVPPFVRAMIDDSDVMGHLLYTLTDPKTLENLLETAKTKPGKAVRALRDMELEIEKAISKPADKKDEARADKEEKPPAETKPRAPKPPTEVGGRGTGTEDESVSAARSGNFAAFEAAERRKMQARFSK